MRSIISPQNHNRTPAISLGSVSMRYRHPLAVGGLRGRIRAPGAGGVNLAEAPKELPAVARSATRRSQRIRRLEAVLFLSREPVSARKLSQFADLADAGEARTLIRRLNALYDRSGRSFRVEEAAGGYRLQTRARFANWIRRCPQTPRELRLSAPALETLTVIAYRQPVARSEIEAIRGVNCGEILRQLLDRDFIKIAGRSEELGRPYLYETTPRFLQAFGLRRIEDLPTLRRSEAVSESQVRAEPTNEEIPLREGDAEVSVSTMLKTVESEEARKSRGAAFVNPFSPRLAAPKPEEDADEDEDEDEEWDDEEDDEEDDDLEDDEEEEEDDEDLEDAEWEEVDDEEEEDDLEEEDDEEEDDLEEDEEWEDDEEEDDEDWDDDDDEEEDDEEKEVDD